MNETMMTNREAAAYLRISLPTLWRLRAAGMLAYYRNGGKLLFSKADLDAYLAKCRRGGK